MHFTNQVLFLVEHKFLGWWKSGQYDKNNGKGVYIFSCHNFDDMFYGYHLIIIVFCLVSSVE